MRYVYALYFLFIATETHLLQLHRRPSTMTMRSLLSVVPFIAALTNARDITFPPVSGYSSQQIVFQGPNDADITTSKFAGLMTYANLPYVHCLAPEGQDVEPFDIAIVGAPFDTVS
jgi:agmatinase